MKATFTAATEAEDRPAAQERRAFEAEARRQSLLIAEAARDPNSDEAAVMREIEAELADARSG